jgi:hypothetical protein
MRASKTTAGRGPTRKCEGDATVPLITILCGILLIPLGLIIFEQTGREHYTALFPCVLGLLFVLLGGLSYKDKLRKHTMHTAALLGVVGFIATAIRAVPALVTLMSGGEVKSVPATVGTSTTAGICLVFVILCVNSFIQARRRRRQAQTHG